MVNHIPVIDFLPFNINSVDQIDLLSAENKAVSKELISAFENIGFAYLKNHGIPDEQVSMEILDDYS